MSASLWDQLPASAGALLTNEECFLLLDTDIFNSDDLLRTCCPTSPTKAEYDNYQLQEDACTSLYPPSPEETKPDRAELANDLLQQLENQCKQENFFPSWLEEKVELPIFENISQVAERVSVEPPVYCAPPAPPALHAPHAPPTEELLREFELVQHLHGVAELTPLTHLTPPQSPPGPATQLLLTYAHQAQATHLAPVLPQDPPQWQLTAAPLPLPLPLTLPLPDYECGFEDVEELVRDRAAQLVSPQPSGSGGSGGGSACDSPQSSPPSSPRSSSTDEEWSASTPSRPKPYSRSPDDRRYRKKEQNKNAATRYRQKKKNEIEVLLSEEQTMRQRNAELGDKCSDLQREIRYLKGLMRDLFKAKGLIK